MNSVVLRGMDLQRVFLTKNGILRVPVDTFFDRITRIYRIKLLKTLLILVILSKISVPGPDKNVQYFSANMKDAIKNLTNSGRIPSLVVRMKIVNIQTQPKCIPEIAAWFHQEWGHLSSDKTLDDRIRHLTERCRNDDLPVTFVAANDGDRVEDDEIVGTVSLVPHDLKSRMDLTPWVAAVFVKPEARGRGVGSRLVGFAETEAQRRGIPTLYLFTPDKQRMYARLGWTTIEEVEYRGEQVTVMTKSCPPVANSAIPASQ